MEIHQKNGSATGRQDNASIPFENYLSRLHRQPDGKQVKANSKDSLPIAGIEEELDIIYKGLWSTENFRWQVVDSEITGSIDLKVFHPVTFSWITRTGCASIVHGDFTHLKTECVKNAAQSLGQVLGRNFNRE